MRAKNETITVISKVIAFVLILLLIAGVVGFFVVYTNGFTSDFRSFYVEYGGEKILRDKTSVSLQLDKPHRFDCRYVFASGQDGGDYGYNVSVIPNADGDTDFEFTVGENVYSYSALEDLTPAFDIERNGGYFILTLPSDFGMQSVLCALFPEETVSVPAEVTVEGYYYTLVVSSYNERTVYYISFNCFFGIASLQMSEERVII